MEGMIYLAWVETESLPFFSLKHPLATNLSLKIVRATYDGLLDEVELTTRPSLKNTKKLAHPCPFGLALKKPDQ
jgi:hypothetical protein